MSEADDRAELEEIIKHAVRVHDFYPAEAAKAIIAAGWKKATVTRETK